jgi:hypothetical protein
MHKVLERRYDSAMNLINAILETPQGPCEVHKCNMRDECAKKELACDSFFYYVTESKCALPTEPNAHTYRVIFLEEDVLWKVI